MGDLLRRCTFVWDWETVVNFEPDCEMEVILRVPKYSFPSHEAKFCI